MVTPLPVAASQRLVTSVSAVRAEEGRVEPESASERGSIPHRERALGCLVQCILRQLSNELKSDQETWFFDHPGARLSV